MFTMLCSLSFMYTILSIRSRGKDNGTKVVHKKVNGAEDSVSDNGYKEFLAFINS